jgi:hypothetical protein
LVNLLRRRMRRYRLRLQLLPRLLLPQPLLRELGSTRRLRLRRQVLAMELPLTWLARLRLTNLRLNVLLPILLLNLQLIQALRRIGLQGFLLL